MIMKCERCSVEHDGKYGSGRFCGRACACSFSTAARREEINQRVSTALTGRPQKHAFGFKPGYDPRRRIFSAEDRRRGTEANTRLAQERHRTLSFDQLPWAQKRARIMAEQEAKCLWCGIDSWRGTKIVLELDHISGDKKDERRENLRLLCPNCHSQTPTFRSKNRKRTRGESR